MKFALPALCLAVSIPAAVVSASSGRLQGGGARPIQAEKATAAESAAAKAVRSLETKSGANGAHTAAGRGALRSSGVTTRAAFFNDVVSKASSHQEGRRLEGCSNPVQVGSVGPVNIDPNPSDDNVVTNTIEGMSIVGDKYDYIGYNYEGMTSNIKMSEDGQTLIASAKLNVNNDFHNLEGALKVYKLSSDGGTWELIKQFDGQVESGRLGYANAISADGRTVAFTDEFSSASTGRKGIVHVWRFDGVDWTELGSGVHYDPQQNNQYFGRKISMSADGETIAVRGMAYDYRPGEITIWKYDAATDSWAQKGGTLNQGPGRTLLGEAISLSANGERILLGNQAFDPPNFTDKFGGYGRVYQYDGIDGDADNINGWTQLGDDIRPQATADYEARFGENVDMSADGTKIVIGMGRDSDPQFFTYQLSDSGTEWTQNAKVTVGFQGCHFVAMSNGGNRIIVGGPPGWGLYNFDGTLEHNGDMNTRDGLAISGDGKSVVVTWHRQYVGPVYGNDARGAIYVYNFGDTCPADYGSMGALANPSASGAGDATSTGESGATSYVGETQTLEGAETAAIEAADTVTVFFLARSANEVAQHNLDVASTQLVDTTTAHAEAEAKAVALTKKYDQAVAYEATMQKAFDDATSRAVASDATPAERYRLPIEAEIAFNEATAVKVEAENAKEAADTELASAATLLILANDAKALAEIAGDSAKAALDQLLAEVNANLLIPKINPTTLDFPYIDTDNDLIPNDFDACPTQMGLRRNTDDRTSSVNPGPQDFCPSGCPETDVNGAILDSDNDGISDCEDRCPFEAGIKYNHLWTKLAFDADDIDSLDANMAYHGCPDRDSDGIPDVFDACPTQAGGVCYSGCPDKGVDPVTGEAYDGDMDGVSDCVDRCPGFYGPGNSGGCPDGDFDGVPDYRDYCPSNPGTALFAYERKLESNTQKYMNILGCPDTDKDLVPDQADLCDAPVYPNQDADTYSGLTRVAVVNNKGCPLDSDQDGVHDGIDNCDGTVHSVNPVHDSRATVFSPTDDSFSVADDEYKLGCPKDSDNDGVADGIDQCPDQGGYIGRDGCPIDSDNDGVMDCISNQAPTSAYTWPLEPTACHSTQAKPDADCCSIEQDMCADTVRGATVYADVFTLEYDDMYEKADEDIQPGCPFDSDTDGVADGVDLCPYTTKTEIDLAESNPTKVSVDDYGCAVMSSPMWEPNFLDVTIGSVGANPQVQLLFTVDALLPQLATTRGYDVANELVAVQLMDASCTNSFDDETDTGDKLLPATVAVNDKGLFTGGLPTDSIPIMIDLDLNPDNVVGSEIWTTEPPFDVGTIDFCLGFAVLSDTKKSITYKELKTTILIDMTQDFSVADISVERNEAEETTKLIDVEFPLAACQCTADNTCVEDSALDDSFLSQSDSLKLCVRFAPDTENGDVLPPDYVQMTDVKSFTCNQDGLSISPIVNFERQGDAGQLVSVETMNKALGDGESYTDDDRMLIVDARLPATFFGAEERPVDCVGTIVYEFAAGSVIDPSLVGTDRQRLLSEASVPLTSSRQASRRDAEEAPEAEAESEFSVEFMLAKATGGRSLGVIAGAAVASALVVVSGAAVGAMAIRRPLPALSGVPKMSNDLTSVQESWTETSASTQEEGRAFTITNGAVA